MRGLWRFWRRFRMLHRCCKVLHLVASMLHWVATCSRSVARAAGTVSVKVEGRMPGTAPSSPALLVAPPRHGGSSTRRVIDTAGHRHGDSVRGPAGEGRSDSGFGLSRRWMWISTQVRKLLARGPLCAICCGGKRLGEKWGRRCAGSGKLWISRVRYVIRGHVIRRRAGVGVAVFG